MALTLELFPIILFAVCALYILLIIWFKTKADSAVAEEEAQLLTVEKHLEKPEVSQLRAVVRCSIDRNITKKRLQYDRMTDCRLFKELYENEAFCAYGCLGYGTCVSYCPQKAILIHNGTAVITDSCNGCGICVDQCPQKIIQLVPLEKEYYVQCAATGVRSNKNCSVSCQDCGLCSPDTSLSLELANKCPTKRIQKISFPNKLSFKLKHLFNKTVSKNSKQK